MRKPELRCAVCNKKGHFIDNLCDDCKPAVLLKIKKSLLDANTENKDLVDRMPDLKQKSILRVVK